MKRLLLLVTALFSLNGVALDVMTCNGKVGNGFSSYKSEYRTYGKKTVTFAIDCGWVDRYVGGGKDCISYLNSEPVEGYYSKSDNWVLFGTKGRYTPKTKFLTYKLGKGYMQKGNVQSLSQTERWFNGYCTG